MKDKKGITITNPFQKIFSESNCKPNKIWIEKGSEFCIRSTKSWLQQHVIEMYSTYNKGTFVVAKIFVGTLKLMSAIFYHCFIFSPNDSPSKTMKSVFYFI